MSNFLVVTFYFYSVSVFEISTILIVYLKNSKNNCPNCGYQQSQFKKNDKKKNL